MAKHDWSTGDKDGLSAVACIKCAAVKTARNSEEDCPLTMPRTKPKFMEDKDFDLSEIGERLKQIQAERTME